MLFLVVMLATAATPFFLLPDDRALASASGAAAIWLLLLLPTDIHLWGITVARDLPGHGLGLVAVLAAARRRFVASGVMLGLASVIRPDAVLYGASITAVAALVRPGLREAVAASAAYLVAAGPLFAYNWITQGSPFAFTQGGEFRDVLGSIQSPASMVVAQATWSGGAFRVAHLVHSLPGNLEHLFESFGWMVVPLAVAVGWAPLRRPLVAAALLPYPVIAVLFYSFWSHPDARYLAGVALCSIPLVGIGLAVLAERAGHPDASRLWRIGAVAFALAAALARSGLLPAAFPKPSTAAWASAVAIGLLALLAPLARSRSRVVALCVLVPPLVLTGVGISNLLLGGQRRDPFQRPQVERARSVFGALVPPGSLVVTDTSLGRPAENITHYTGARSVYGSELDLLDTSPTAAVMQYRLTGRRVFYLLDERDQRSLGLLRDGAVKVRLVERRAGPRLLEWFVNPLQATAGAVLFEVDLSDEVRRGYESFVEKGIFVPHPGYPAKPGGAPPP
jgi:hypothetical protein